MTSRWLPAEEWARKLAGTELASVHHLFDTTLTRIAVVEDGDVVVACWAFFPVVHAEGLWIHPKYRTSRHPWQELRGKINETAQDWGITTINTYAGSPEIGHLLEKFGAKAIDLPEFVLPLPVRKVGQS
jgi:hypothetical protein